MEFESLVNYKLKTVGVPVKFGDTKASIRHGLPLLGEHSDEILLDLGVVKERK